jgi:serine/threonine-protein kinase CTR1
LIVQQPDPTKNHTTRLKHGAPNEREEQKRKKETTKMELPRRRAIANPYSVLNQISDDYDPSLPPLPHPIPLPLPLQLQRQSSGSSYGDSSLSLSGDCFFVPPPVDPITGAKSDPIAGGGELGDGSGSGSGSGKSWAQQAEETYQLQLALALRLCSEAASVSDPGLMDAGDPATAQIASGASAETLSHRFWVCYNNSPYYTTGNTKYSF